MKHQTLALGSVVAVGVIAIVICVGMVSGYSVFKQYISVDPVSDRNAGDVFAVTGTTNLPVGTELMVEIYPKSFEEHVSDTGEFSGAIGTADVTSGFGGVNTWSMEVNTSVLVPMEYLVNASVPKGDIKKGNFATGDTFGSTTFTLHAAAGKSTASSAAAGTSAVNGIVIDQIPDTTRGTPLTVTGRTSLPAGTGLSVKVVPASTDTETFLHDYQNPEKSTEITVVKGDGTDNRFSVTLDTRTLSPAEHIIVVSSKGSGTGSDDSGWTGSAIFNILSGTGSTGYIRVDPITKKTTGDLVLVTGSTNLAAGTSLMVSAGNWRGNTMVNAGTGGVNRYSIPVDTSAFHPGTLTVNVTEMTGDPAKGNYVAGSVHGVTTFVLGGSFLGTDTPVQVTPAASDFIAVNKIGDRSVGDQFLITGTTSLPVGTTLLWQIMPDTGTTPTGVNKTAMGLGGSNMVTKGSGTANRVSFAADMNQMPAGKWVALVGVMKDGEFEVEKPIATAYFTVT